MAFEDVIERVIGKELWEKFIERAKNRKIKDREDLVKIFEECGLDSREAKEMADKFLILIPEKVARRLGVSTLGMLYVYLSEEIMKIGGLVEEVIDRMKSLEERFDELKGLMECYKAYYTYIPFDLYKTIRREIEELHHYEFVERKIEGKESMRWLDDAFKDNLVVAIFGDGGMGKTRLTLEFSKRLVEREVYFFNPHAEYGEPCEMRNALVVLDDAHEGICEKVLNFCLGLSGRAS